MKRVSLFLFVLMFSCLLPAQERKESVRKVYRASYAVYELEDGKRTNERSYVLPVVTVDGNTRTTSLKIGTRVPVTTKENQITYLDVGLAIDSWVAEQTDKFIVFTEFNISSVVADDSHSQTGPVLRQVRESATTLAYPGKPTLVTSIDDVNSKKRFQVEVTVTRIE